MNQIIGLGDGLVVIILASNSGDLISNPDIGIIFLMNTQKDENKFKKWVGSSPFKKARGSLRVWVLPITLPTKDTHRQTSVLFMVHWSLYCLAFYVPTNVAPLALWWGTHSLQLRLSDQTFVCLKCFWCLPSFILF